MTIKPDTLVVGIDVAKFNHVARALLPGGAVTRPFGFANSQEGFWLCMHTLLPGSRRQRRQ